MAGVALADAVERLTREAWRSALAVGLQARLGWSPEAYGKVAKAAGCTPETLQAWLDGSVMPSTSQALAVLSALPLPEVGTVAAMNGTGP